MDEELVPEGDANRDVDEEEEDEGVGVEDEPREEEEEEEREYDENEEDEDKENEEDEDEENDEDDEEEEDEGVGMVEERGGEEEEGVGMIEERGGEEEEDEGVGMVEEHRGEEEEDEGMVEERGGEEEEREEDDENEEDEDEENDEDDEEEEEREEEDEEEEDQDEEHEEEREEEDEEEEDQDEEHEEKEEEPDNNGGTDEDDDEEEEDDEDEEMAVHGWGFLPSVCLWRLFWWLRDRDRMCANLVCRHWHAVMHSPSLWRFRRFHLSGRLTRFRRSEPLTTLTYARHLGGYLETLEVCVSSPHSSMVARRLQYTLCGLLDELTRAGTRLRSLSLTGLELDRTGWPRAVRGSLVRCLAHFFRRGASQLGSVSLKGARTSLRQGMQLLSALSHSQQHQYLRGRPGISSLDLDDFFSGPLPVHLHPSLPLALHSLRGLSSLGLSYSCVSDELLQALGQNGWGHGRRGRGYGWARERGILQSLRLRCHVNEAHSQVVCDSSWEGLVERCPGLEVQLHVEQVVNTDRLGRVLLPQVPLTDYSMTSCYFTESDWSAKPVLSEMLPQYWDRLQHVTLDLNNCHESLDEELLELVEVCVCLQHLKVWAFLEINTVEQLLQARLEKRTSLNTLKVRIYSVSDDNQEEEEELEEVLCRYTHLTAVLHFSASIHPII
ncbi:F-box only protein 39-like [Osmerus mordax]|uniref:F-box only protein 39-like n=1 Tax=Osmerus mordax TaxID=8014 RepID=UPI0035108E54